MSEQSVMTKEAGKGQKHGPFKFGVDGKPLQSEQPELTGAQIKALAQVDPSFGLFLEGRGNQADQQIADGQLVDLREPGREHFYTAPGATFGSNP